ncbi:MAG TPA: fumarylacetoacetate hydrolase family protein, partial [Acidimicrobiales bacterium]|nr:fumarylacetoacetate hydrolase family protein [Acidimicrobiales bacterium]
RTSSTKEAGMRIARVATGGEERTTVIDGSWARILAPTVTVLDLLAAGAAERERLAATAESEAALGDVGLLAPVAPATIRDFSVFEQHVEGVVRIGGPGVRVPEVWYKSPFCYFSNPHALTGPDAEIPVPPGCVDLDFELEVAAVIGRAGRDLHPDEAGAHIAGYTIFNDWSARDLQLAEMRLGLGPCKGKDFANTLGPWIVTADELEPHRDGDRLDLELRAEINGAQIDADTLANMAWSFEELVAYASRGTWVRPGDVLGSGTCGGGCLLELWGRRGREGLPPLAPGDEVALHVEGIGTLRNRIVAGTEPIALPRARARR